MIRHARNRLPASHADLHLRDALWPFAHGLVDTPEGFLFDCLAHCSSLFLHHFVIGGLELGFKLVVAGKNGSILVDQRLQSFLPE